jgi:hypothetical protein
MNFLTNVLTALFQALLPFLKQQAMTPTERAAAEQDPSVQGEVNDAIEQYDRDHHASAD